VTIFKPFGGFAAATAGLMLTMWIAPALAANEVNIYSYRKEHLIRPQLEAFANATGIAYNIVTGRADALALRIQREGVNSPADVLLTVDAGRLVRAKALRILQPIRSAALERAIPARYRDPEGHWFGLGLRARTLFYAVDRVDPATLSTYEALTDATWKGRILVRSSSNIYNQSLLASLIHHHGLVRAEAWARGIVANLARKPQGGDRDQLRGVAAGVGDVAIANHYYYAQLKASTRKRDRLVVEKVKPFWPNQAGRGVHVNVSGAGVTRHAPNKANAIKLIEFLASPAGQRLYADHSFEIPVRAGVEASAIVKSLGAFEPDVIDLEILGRNNAEAVKAFDRAGWR
jgi:iron(III) transport system substrate-binding protein